MSRARRILIAAALALPAVPAAAHVSCTVSSPGVPFGVYDPKSASNLDGAGTVKVTCDQSSGGITVSADGGGSGNVNARRMTNGTSNLSYQLYTNSGRTTVFSPTNQLSYSIGGTLTQTQSIFGRITALQNVTAGSYSDSVIITVTF